MMRPTEPGYTPRALSRGAMRRLQQHEWRGNVRELYSVLARTLIMSVTPDVGREEIDQEILQIRRTRPDVFSPTREKGFMLKKRLEQIEKAFIETALEEADGVQREAAKLLDDNPSTLNQRIKRLGISP